MELKTRLIWETKELVTNEDMRDVLVSAKYVHNFDLMAIDTETSGLHIIKDKPFSIQFALADLTNRVGFAYCFDVRNKNEAFMNSFESLVRSCKLLIAWNAKFDAHMCANIGIDLFQSKKYTDGMIYARLATDALPPKNGGVSLGLKEFCKKFIDPNCDYYEKQLNKYKKDILIRRNSKLKELGALVGEINKFLSDKINDVDDLPPDIANIIKDPQYNPNDYSNIPWDVLKIYGVYDPILTVEAYLYCYPIVRKREQLEIAELETKIIPILWGMERTGLALNKYYLLQTKEKVKEYIIECRKNLNDLVGQPLKIGQHDLIKQIFYSDFDIVLETSNEEALQEIANKEGKPAEIAKQILELRTLEKWYSTYICRWLEQSEGCDKIYTSFNQVGAVSGRFSSDFQQFPKDTIYKKDGEPLFVPRRIIKVSGEGYDKLFFIDFSAEELRIQAAYTILVGDPDVNLCRAFMPYKCDPKTWKPTDLHTLTTLNAFPNLKEDDPDFKHYRYIGKRANFCINYGGTKKALMENLNCSEEIATNLYNAYKKAYPGVQSYKNYVTTILNQQNFIRNLFGRRYYNAPSHNCCNYLIQGSGADLLKNKLIQLDEYLKPYKSRMICMIHDEIVFEVYKGEEAIVPELKRIMESFKELPIPLKSEVEMTTTTWDAKELYEITSN